MDLDLKAVQDWQYTGWLTWNVALWPRLVLLFANRRRYERLSSVERGLLKAAARAAVTGAASKPHSFARKDLPPAVQVVSATEGELERIRDRLQPIHTKLRSISEGETTLRQTEHYLAGR